VPLFKHVSEMASQNERTLQEGTIGAESGAANAGTGQNMGISATTKLQCGTSRSTVGLVG
jgi:hypothetical protein